MSDHRDTNHDGKVSLMEKVKDKLHLGHHHDAATTHHTTGVVPGVVPVAGVVPVVATHDSRDLNHDGHISTTERLATGSHMTGAHSGLHTGAHTGAHTTGAHHSGHESDEARLRLHEEQLAISKREVGAGEVDIHKRVQEEHVQQTIPLRHEEVVVERRPLHGHAEPGARIAAQDETVRIPLHREEILTEKRVVPTEEVIVRKNHVTGQETVGATLRSEYVETNQTGGTLHGATTMDTHRDGHLATGEKRKGAYGDSRDTNHDGHVSTGEKLKSARG
jgi:uncharacterized protein (TIGR02271 family)